MRRIVCFFIVICSLFASFSQVHAEKSWPYPIPCRIQDGNNPDLFIMTLGDVDTTLAQGTYDPVKDQVTLKDGTIKEHYYRDTLGVAYYQPIDKTRFPLPPSGWCTWYYYYPRITATEVKRNARWISENLKDYGARFVQIDDGWQGSGGREGGRDWSTVNPERFPDGMADVASHIKSVGLTPGIWLAPHGQSNETVVKQNQNVFLLKPDGTTASDTWEGKYLIDPTTPQTHAYLKALFTKLCDWGYDYFKIDGQPIVANEYRNKKSFMKNPEDDTNGLYRKTLESIRQTIGPDRYLLGCWGIPVEGVNIMNGSRTGGDIVLGWGGFQVALRAVMQYYYQHNIIWYADPDVMVLRSPLTMEQARVWATLQGLTGQALMATDRMMDLSEDRVEMLRRVYPAVDIRPLDLFPSERNKRIWDLKVNHLGRRYDVVGVFNFDETTTEQMYLKWADLGLPIDRPLHVFDFWNKEYLGAWEAGIALDVAPTSCRVLTVLPSTGQIQLISTNRHITQGRVDLMELNYNEGQMSYSGKSRVIKNDPYELHFVFPRDDNFAVKSVMARSGGSVKAASLGDGDALGTSNHPQASPFDSAQDRLEAATHPSTGSGQALPVTHTNHQGWATVKIHSDQTTEATWEVRFEPTDIFHYPTGEPTNLRVERVGLDGANLTWNEQYWLNVGYQVYLDGKLQGYTPKAAFPLRGLDPKATYAVGVETVWEDGTASPRKVEQKFSLKSTVPKQMPLSQLKPLREGSRRGRIVNQSVSIGDKSYQNGIIMRPGSDVVYDIKGLYSSFSAMVGIGDESNSDISVEFVVVGDDKELWRSTSLKKADCIRAVNVDVTGIRHLMLRVTGESSRRSRVQAAWIDATLVLNHR